jgi:Na+/melibiose symporter-like transporter
MDVLNTTGGEYIPELVFLAIFGGVLALVLIIIAIAMIDQGEDGLGALVAGIFIGLLAAVLLYNAKDPIRHEVTLRPGHVIDATKYEIVEQRGKIYVIEEREASE